MRPASTTAGGVEIETLRVHSDERGSLFEPVDEPALAAQRNVHVVLTWPNAVRGNHYHREAWEVTTVFGPCLVRWRDADGLHDVDVPAGEAWRFRIPPGVAHAYRNTGTTAMVLVSFGSRPHDPSGGDTVSAAIL